MAGPIGHGVARAMREARSKGKLGGGGGGNGGPAWWVWALIAAGLIAGMTWAGLTLR